MKQNKLHSTEYNNNQTEVTLDFKQNLDLSHVKKSDRQTMLKAYTGPSKQNRLKTSPKKARKS